MIKLILSKLIVIAAVLFTSLAYAESKSEPADISTRMLKYHMSHFVNDDFTQVSRIEYATKILDERAIQNAKVRKLSYSTSIEKLQIHEAYTLKHNGERIAVPENNYQQNVNTGRENKGPVFSDRTSLSVVYPDVQVGDTIFLAYSVTTKEPMFPGHFTALSQFAPSGAYDDVVVSLNVPKSLKAAFRVRQMQETVKEHEGRLIHTLRYQNSNPVKETRTDFSVWDMETYPGFIYSTFDSWQEVVDAYAKRALPKSDVTDRIRKLATSIVQGEINKREKARLLYEWVAKNITYAGNCIGVGAVVPHDITFILDNRMGDCKDQATLLQALLTAEGIKSSQALVNAGSVYELPSVPTVRAVNHVINYLPEFDLFVDATSETVPFGLISMQIQDKPVLLVDGYKEGMRTPASSQVDTQKLISTIEIDQQGNASGKIEVQLDGLVASNARSGFRHVTPESEKEWLEDLFSHDGYKGFGTLIKEDPKQLKDSFNYQVDFSMEKYLPLYGLAAFVIQPDLPTPLAVNSLLGTFDEVNTVDMVCRPVRTEERYTIKLPENIEIIATPDPAVVEGAGIHYRSEYSFNGNTLEVHRTLEDKTQGNICSYEDILAQKEIIQKIIWDVDSQVVYKVARK